MIADTVIPEAYSKVHLLTGLVTVVGFLSAFALSHPVAAGPRAGSPTLERA